MNIEWIKKRYKIIIFICLICPVLLIYPAVEMTSTASFCSICHEIRPAVESWKVSPHGIVNGKSRATCRDCHIPSWKNPASVITSKSSHGIKDTYHHFFSKEEMKKQDFYFAMKHRSLKSMPDDRCTVCHTEVFDMEKDIIESETGIVKGLHTEEEVKKLSCLMCHKHTGHLPFY